MAFWRKSEINKQTRGGREGGKRRRISSAEPSRAGARTHTHTQTRTHAHKHTQRARLLSRRGYALALNSSKVQGELKPGREARGRRPSVPGPLPGVVGGVVRAGGQAALAPFRVHSALRCYIPALRGEERQ